MTAADKKIKPVTLAGFRDILPAAALVKEDMISILKQVFRRFGFAPIETPHLEYTEMLTGAGAEINKQLYRFRDNGDRDVTLRFDHTVPLARFISQHKNTLGLPFKRYAIGSVFRGESPQAGRYREFTQCDFDFIGSKSVSADAEIVQVLVQAISMLGLTDFTVSINSRPLLNAVADHFGFGDRMNDLLRIIDKFDKIGRRGVAGLLTEELGADADRVNGMLNLIAAVGTTEEIMDRLTATGHAGVGAAADEMRTLFKILDQVGLPTNSYRPDLSIARGLAYYTGIVYETRLNALPKIGSVASGGRYDNLTESFAKDPMPGVGASVGLDRLMSALEEIGKMSAGKTPKGVLIGILEENCIGQAHALAAKVRMQGIQAEVYPSIERIGKLFGYAERRNIPLLIAYGEQEALEERFVLADLSSGEKTPVTGTAGLIKLITDRLNAQP